MVITSSTYLLAPKQYLNPALPVIQAAGKGSFDLNSYPVLDRRIIGLVNLFRDYYKVTDLSNASVNDLSMLPTYMTNYFLAFTTYGMAKIVDVTPNYRTDYYKDVFHKLIALMNSSQMEQIEWTKPGFSDPLYSNLGNGFRGPTNIMWTGHYALMELLYYSAFRDTVYNDEITSYMNQWNASLTSNTLWNGAPSEGLGRWGTGLISCEPYIVFVQCNSIPFYGMRLYDKLHNTTYQLASLPGIEWWQKNMVNSDGIPIDGYYVAKPNEKNGGMGNTLQTYPGPALTKGLNTPKVSGYGSAWITMFYNGMGMTEIANKLYKNWKEEFVHYSTEDTAYVVESYYYPKDFGLYEYVANLFAYFCSREMGDTTLFNQLDRWFYSPFEGRWDGYKYEYDTSVLGSLSGFTYPVVNFAWAWTHTDSSLKDLLDPNDDAFFSYPYISDQTIDDGLFVYQAYYDSNRSAFILTVETANKATLTFNNFPNVRGVYTVQGQYADWAQKGNQMLLTLSPGTYSFIIT